MKLYNFFLIWITSIQSLKKSRDKITTKHGKNNTIQDISAAYDAIKYEKEKLEIEMSHLKEIDKQKDEFVSMISHELKTPLTTIKGYLEILQEQDFTKTFTSIQNESIDKIYENTEKLEILISDMLDSQKLTLDKIKFHKTKIDLKIFLTKIFNDYKPLMKSKQIQLTLCAIEKIITYTDEQRLSQVIDNLIKNAINFIPLENGEIEIGAKLESGRVLFFVKDNGTGISKKNQSHIFKKFYQIDTTNTRNHGGTGLGLVICEGIIKGLGGKIWLESEGIGHGCVFYFTIPIN